MTAESAFILYLFFWYWQKCDKTDN